MQNVTNDIFFILSVDAVTDELDAVLNTVAAGIFLLPLCLNEPLRLRQFDKNYKMSFK